MSKMLHSKGGQLRPLQGQTDPTVNDSTFCGNTAPAPYRGENSSSDPADLPISLLFLEKLETYILS